MKKLLSLLFIAAILSSCSDLEDNAPAFQGNIDNVFYKATESRATKRNAGSYTIQGITNNEILTLKVERSRENTTYELGGNSLSFATFEDENGNIYSTNPEGWGEVTITRKNTGQRFFNGTFKFTAIRPGLDTIVVDRGVFFEVPYDFNTTNGEDDPSEAELFIAQVDSNPFNPFDVSALKSNGSITVTGSNANKEIILRVPEDITLGSNELPQAGFEVSYREGANTESAVSGNIYIIENDPVGRILKGSFSFETTNYSVTLGQFNVSY